MCTLSVIVSGSAKIITMNRDEDRNREEGKTLHTTDQHCFPIDKKSQGTWIGMNRHGVVLAILNRYQDQQNFDQSNTKSRGRIIPALLPKSSLAEIQKNIHSFGDKSYNPFDFLAITNNNWMHASWNGESLSIANHKSDDPFFITSSSEHLEDVSKYRQDKFQKFCEQNKKAEITPESVINNLHQRQKNQYDPSAIFMRRTKTHTKSITQIILEKNATRLSYQPVIDPFSEQDSGRLYFDFKTSNAAV